VDLVSSNGKESLKIGISGTTEVLVCGHFAPWRCLGCSEQNGRIAQIIFSNEVITGAASMM